MTLILEAWTLTKSDCGGVRGALEVHEFSKGQTEKLKPSRNDVANKFYCFS